MSLTTNKIVVALFGMAAGGYKSTIDGFLAAHGAVATVAALLPYTGLNPALLGQEEFNNQRFAETLVARMLPGLDQTVAATTASLIVNYMAAMPSKSRASVVVDLIQVLDSIPATDPVFGNVARTFDDKVALADAYQGTSTDWRELANVVDNGGTRGNQGTSFTLTAGVDLADDKGSSASGQDTSATFKFSNADEKVIAPAGTLTAGDVLRDPSTSDNDVLEAVLNSLAAPAVTLQNIETIRLNAVLSAGFDMSGVVGAKRVEVTGAGDLAISGLGAPSGVALAMVNYDRGLSVKANLSGNNDTLSVSLSGAGGNARLSVDGAAPGQRLETLALSAMGSTVNTMELVAGPNNPSLGKITLGGAADIVLRSTHALVSDIVVDASAHTGDFALVVDRHNAARTPTNLAQAGGYDSLVLRDSDSAGADSASVANLLTGSRVVLATGFTAASTLAVKDAAVNPNDRITLVLEHERGRTDLDFSGARYINLPDVEHITVVSEGALTGNKLGLVADATKSLVIDGGSALEFMFGGNNARPTSVVIKGAGNHSFRLATQTIEYANADLTVDARQATGELTIDVSDFEGSKGETATVRAGSGNDTIRLGGGGAYAKFVVNAGAGADTIETIHGTEMWVTTGAGSDTIRMSISDPPVPIPTKLVITDFTPGASGDRLAFENLLSAAFVFDKDGVDLQANEVFVYTGASVTGTGANGAVQVSDLSATLTPIANDSTALLIVLNAAVGRAEAYAVVADTTPGWAGDEVTLLARFDNLNTLSGLNELVASNFGVF